MGWYKSYLNENNMYNKFSKTLELVYTLVPIKLLDFLKIHRNFWKHFSKYKTQGKTPEIHKLFICINLWVYKSHERNNKI